MQEHHVQRIYGTSIINVENISATTQFIEYERVHESTLPEQAKMILNAEMGQRSEKWKLVSIFNKSCMTFISRKFLFQYCKIKTGPIYLINCGIDFWLDVTQIKLLYHWLFEKNSKLSYHSMDNKESKILISNYLSPSLSISNQEFDQIFISFVVYVLTNFIFSKYFSWFLSSFLFPQRKPLFV